MLDGLKLMVVGAFYFTTTLFFWVVRLTVVVLFLALVVQSCVESG